MPRHLSLVHGVVATTANARDEFIVQFLSYLGEVESLARVSLPGLNEEISCVGIRLEVAVGEPFPHDECYRGLIDEMGTGIYGSIYFAGGVGCGEHAVALGLLKILTHIHGSPL